MQYLVYSKGKIVENQDKAYVVKAESAEEARNIAKEAFAEEYCVIDEDIYTKPYKRTRNAILAFVFMAISIFLSFIDWKVGHETVKISPDYMSCVYALLFYTAYIVRFKGFMRTVGSWIDIGFCATFTLLLASFIRTLMGVTNISILGLFEIKFDSSIIFPVAILFSWLGLKLMSVLSIACIGILALFNITALNEAMGNVWGPVYVLCAFIGTILYCSVEPALVEGLPHLGKNIGQGVVHMGNDFSAATETVRKVGKSVSRHIEKPSE